MRRSPIIAVLLVIVAFTGLPGAARAGLVRSFGHNGVAPLAPPLPPGVERLREPLSQSAPDGSTYLLTASEPCLGKHCSDYDYLFRFRPGGRPDPNFGGRGFVRLDAPEQGVGPFSLGVDNRSRPILTRSVCSGKTEGLQVLRFGRGGRLDRALDGDGRLFLPKMKGYRTEIQPLGHGEILLSSEENEGPRDVATVSLEELHGNGHPVRNFGGDGFVAVQAPGSFHLTPAPTTHGAILVAATGCCTEAVSLVRISASGHLDRRYDRITRKSLEPLVSMEEGHYEAHLEARYVLAGPRGGAEIFGDYGIHGFEVRLNVDGRPESGFGRRGIRRSVEPLDAALRLPHGRTLALGQGLSGPLRPYLLNPEGRRDPHLRAVALAPYTTFIAATPIGARTVDVTFGRRHDEQEPETEPLFVARLRLPPAVSAR